MHKGGVITSFNYQVYMRIKEMIIANELKPGQKIDQNQLVKDLNISRTPLIYAMNQLKNELLVDIIPNRGVYVKEYSIKELIKIYDIREGLEGIAARECALRINDEQINEISSIFNKFVNSWDENQIRAYDFADRKFHKKMVEITENEFLIQIYNTIHLLITSYRKRIIRNPVETLEEHWQIIDALKRHKAELAESLTRKHLHKSKILMEAEYKKTINT